MFLCVKPSSHKTLRRTSSLAVPSFCAIQSYGVSMQTAQTAGRCCCGDAARHTTASSTRRLSQAGPKRYGAAGKEALSGRRCRKAALAISSVSNASARAPGAAHDVTISYQSYVGLRTRLSMASTEVHRHRSNGFPPFMCRRVVWCNSCGNALSA